MHPTVISYILLMKKQPPLVTRKEVMKQPRNTQGELV